MPLLTDKDSIRRILQRDRRWCVYALGDLTPRMFEKCRWFTPDLTMVLQDYGTSILLAHGVGSIREALEHVSWPVHLQVQPDALEEVKRHAGVTNEMRMLRLAWEGADKDTRAAEGTDKNTRAAEGAENTEQVIRLTARDINGLKQLYADGEATGESPDFFYESMVTDGVFFGIYEGEELIAVSGTHLVSPDEGAAAIGNVYVRRDRRGAGLSRLTTKAVLDGLRGIETVGLNVRADNAAAIRVYESLGFVVHCPFFEGLAHPR